MRLWMNWRARTAAFRTTPRPAPHPVRKQILAAFEARHGGAPDFLVRAPGRVNLIGEHTDYNDGLVFPMAIDRGLWMAVRRTAGNVVRLASLDQAARVEFAVGGTRSDELGWGVYPWAVAGLLAQEYEDAAGFDGVIASEIPAGAGLSSSAALGLATARALHALWGKAWHAKPMSLLCQRAENEGAGVSCGVMDQMIVACGQAGNALLIDCRSLETTPVPVPEGLVVAVLDTGTRRELESSAFNERREQCAAAAKVLAVSSLREVDLERLAASSLDGVLLQRARHVVSENARVQAFARALQEGEHAALGALLADSHRSLREDYDVVTPALDAIVEVARDMPGCVGARMTGAGFGGCAVALLERASAAEFARAVESGYARRTQLQGAVHLCEAADGVGLVDC